MTCPFTETAEEIAVDALKQSAKPLSIIRFWHFDLSTLADCVLSPYEGVDWQRRNYGYLLRRIAWWATAFLANLDVNDPPGAFVAEYERAAAKHPGMTLDADGHTDESRFYALAEEVGEVAASLTYDNAKGTGHQADTIAEVTQVGALALAWLTRYQDGEDR